MGSYITTDMIHSVINEDCDCYTHDGVLLFRFRKSILTKANTELFYDNIIQFAMRKTQNRGTASAVSGLKSVFTNPSIMSNIFGYFDRITPSQKVKLRREGVKLPMEVRVCRFNRDYPDKYKHTIPLINEINELYKQLMPIEFDRQNALALSSLFKIGDTAFTTVTTNVNFQTAIHTDKGDCDEGFGNLIVFDEGHYLGGETCFPEYGIGINVRKGDILFMNVHVPHGNLPMRESNGAIRLSVVCYLRNKLIQRTAGITQDQMDELLGCL